MSFPNSPTRQVSDVSVSSDASKILVALNGGGLVYSDDSGSNWTTQDSNRAWSAAALSSSGTHQAAATSGESTGGLFTSSLSLSLQTSTPSTGQTGFSNKANIVLNFNNKVTLNAGKKISILRSSDNSVFEEFTLPSALVTSSSAAPGTVTINPSGTLALNTTYHLITDASTITDDHGNVWDANSSPLSFTTSSTDTSAPTVVSKSPSFGSVQISLTDNLTITFDEDIRAVAGKFVYMCAHSHTDCRLYSERIPTSDTERLVISGSLLTINPETELQENSTHYILIDAGAFEDLNGNDFAGITTTGFQAYTFAIDGRVPLFRKSCISSDRTKIYLLYDEALVSGTLTTSEFSVVAGGSSQSISSVLVPPHSAHVVVSLSTPIPGGSTPLISYTRHPTVGGIRDALSQRAVSLSSVDASSTSDCAGPTWVSSSPSDGATGVATNASVSLTFDEPITTQFGKSLVLYKNTATAGLHEYIHTNTSTNFSVSGNTLTIVPTTPFATNTTYSVYVLYRGFVEDLAGNDFWGWESTSILDFTTSATSDTSAPSAPSTPDLVTGSDSGSSSTDNLTNDNTPDISVTAAEAGGTVTVTATKSGSSNVTCTMTGSTTGGTCTLGTLAAGEWSITAVHADAAGNTSSASSALTITIDTTAPTRVSFTPTSGATGVAVNASPTITFGDDVVAGSGNITIYSDATCSTTSATIAGTNAQVTISGAVVTINPTTDFALSTVYCITYAAGTFTDSAGNQVTALSSTSTITFTTSSTPPTTAAPAPPATTASTTTTTVPLTARTLTITGAAMRYTVTQEGPGLTAAPSAGGGAISWTSLTPSVCSVSTIAMMSILSAQSSVEVGRLNVVGTCTISATVAATATYSSASTSVTFTVVRARPVVLVSLYDNDHFYAKITLPREISSNTSLLRTMYGSLRFLVVSENCEIDIIASYSDSEGEFGSAWIGLHGRPVFTDSGTCNVRAELPSGDRWFAATSPITAALTRPAATTTNTIPPTTVASAGTTVPDVSTSLPASSSTSEPLSSPPSITSFGPTSTATPVPVIELDVERQIVLESGETEIVFTRESLIKTAENVGVQVGAIRVRTASSAWMETKLPDATDLRLVIRRSDVELNIEVAPEVGDVIRIAVPIVINVDGGFGLRNFTLAFLAGAALMAWWLLVWRRRRLAKPVA